MSENDIKLLLHFIEKNLPDMAKDFDEGIGIASERYFVSKVIDYLMKNKIRTVLEAPSDGLMGIPGMNSVFFAQAGAKVTLGSHSEKLLQNSKPFWNKLGFSDKINFSKLTDITLPFSEKQFDLVWNYCMFEHFLDADKLLKEMIRVSNKYVFIITQNVYNYGYPIHIRYHKKRDQVWDHGYSKWMKMGNLKKLFKKNNLKIVKAGCVDVPPWFDTFDMHTRGKIKGIMSEEQKAKWYWSSLQKGDLERLEINSYIKVLALFEKLLFFPFNYLFAHHFYIIGEKDD